MKFYTLTLAFLLSYSSVNAGITWLGPNGSTSYSTAYTPGTTVTVDADPTLSDGKFEGIEIDFSATTEGTFNVVSRQLNFVTSNIITAGSSFTMYWDFSHQIGSGDGARSAVQFNAGSSIDMNVDTLMYGGDETFQDYWGTSDNPTAQHTNAGILEFQDIFVRDPDSVTDGSLSYGAGPVSAVYTGFTDANTATIAGGQAFPDVLDVDGDDPVSGDANFRFHIVGPQRNATDFNFSGWHFTVNAVEDIAAGSVFLFTYEGIIVDPAIAIPEPSSLGLLGLCSFTFLLRRRR